MNAVAALGVVAAVVAVPDLVTIAQTFRHRAGRHRRRDSVWPLVSVMVVAHAALGVAALLAGEGVS